LDFEEIVANYEQVNLLVGGAGLTNIHRVECITSRAVFNILCKIKKYIKKIRKIYPTVLL
jgi:hypothetical protein